VLELRTIEGQTDIYGETSFKSSPASPSPPGDERYAGPCIPFIPWVRDDTSPPPGPLSSPPRGVESSPQYREGSLGQFLIGTVEEI